MPRNPPRYVEIDPVQGETYLSFRHGKGRRRNRIREILAQERDR